MHTGKAGKLFFRELTLYLGTSGTWKAQLCIASVAEKDRTNEKNAKAREVQAAVQHYVSLSLFSLRLLCYVHRSDFRALRSLNADRAPCPLKLQYCAICSSCMRIWVDTVWQSRTWWCNHSKACHQLNPLHQIAHSLHSFKHNTLSTLNSDFSR